MFFGLEVTHNQLAAKPITLLNNLRLGQAVLDPTSAKKEPVSLVVEYKKKSFIICVLDPDQCWQAPLDLCFEAGSKLRFYIRGTGTVHITGYDVPDNSNDLFMSSDDDIEISNSDDGYDYLGPQRKKKKTNESPKLKANSNGVKGSAKKNGAPVKNKQSADHDEDEDSSEDSMDDEDIDIDEDTSDDSDLLYEDDEDDDDDDEADDDDEDGDEDSEEEDD